MIYNIYLLTKILCSLVYFMLYARCQDSSPCMIGYAVIALFAFPCASSFTYKEEKSLSLFLSLPSCPFQVPERPWKFNLLSASEKIDKQNKHLYEAIFYFKVHGYKVWYTLQARKLKIVFSKNATLPKNIKNLINIYTRFRINPAVLLLDEYGGMGED